MMSGSPAAVTAAWFVTYAVVFAVISGGITLAAAGALFAKSSLSVVFMLFWLFGLSSVAACHMIATLFSRSKLAAIVGSVMLVAMVFPYFSVNDATKPHSVRSAGSLASPTAFGLALDILCAFEAGGSGLQWSDMRSDVGTGWTAGESFGALFFDILLYGVLAWDLGNVWPQEYGLQAKPWFPCTPRYWRGLCCSGSKSSATRADASDFHVGPVTVPIAFGVGGAAGDAAAAASFKATEASSLLLTGGGAQDTNNAPSSIFQQGLVARAPAEGTDVEALSASLASLVTSGRALSVRGLVKVRGSVLHPTKSRMFVSVCGYIYLAAAPCFVHFRCYFRLQVL